jgi:cellulose biosynthesis protein BcsQ
MSGGATKVAVAMTKGGSGKTTTAVCLAQEAQARGRDVIVLDLDPQGTATDWTPQLSKHVPSLTTKEAIIEAADGHDLVILDTPPGAAPQAAAAIEAADVVVAVTGLGPGDMKALLHLFRMVDADLIVPTGRDGRRSLHLHALNALHSRWPTLVTEPVPASAAIEWAQAQQEALPILSPPAVAYRAIDDRLAALEVE